MWKSLGRVIVTVSGILAEATANLPVPGNRLGAHAVMFQQVKGNSGWIYIFDDPSGSKVTGAHLVASLAVPTANTCPSASVTIMYAPAALNAAMYWIDADNNGEGCQVSVILA